jgi:hypothetical protein
MTRHFNCMQAAAEAGLAPRVRYASAEDRISITDFVEAVPFPATDALRRVPAALRRLHALPPFPVAPFNTTCTFLLNKGPTLDGFLHKFRTVNILPEHDLKELLAQYARVAAARFYLMKQLAHMFYAMAFLSLGSAGKPVDWSEPVPAYSDFQRRFWAREVDLADNHSKTIYGKVHWEQLRRNLRQPRFDETLRIVASRHATS